MLLDFIKEYMVFLIMLLGIIIVIIIAYLIISRPGNRFDKTSQSNQEPKSEPKSEPTTLKNFSTEQPKPELNELNEEINEADLNMPNIITSFAETYEEEAVLEEISSNLNKFDNDQEKQTKQNTKEDSKIKNDNILVKKPNTESDDDFSFLNEEDEDKDTEKNPNKRYHVLYLKEQNKWFIKREGNDQILKIFETQKEGIAFATIKSLVNETSVVVHRRDGKIRKYSL